MASLSHNPLKVDRLICSTLTYLVPLKSQLEMTAITSLLLTACNRKDLPKSYPKDFTIVLLKQYISSRPRNQTPDSMGVPYSNGKVTWLGRPLEYRTFWTINRLFSEHHSNLQPDSNLPFEYQTCPVFRWYCIWMTVSVWILITNSASLS